MTTVAPRFTSPVAISLPMPDVAPVTRQVFPLRSAVVAVAASRSVPMWFVMLLLSGLDQIIFVASIDKGTIGAFSG
jgi:hypothetical protein